MKYWTEGYFTKGELVYELLIDNRPYSEIILKCIPIEDGEMIFKYKKTEHSNFEFINKEEFIKLIREPNNIHDFEWDDKYMEELL
jgi:hypothetical protein